MHRHRNFLRAANAFLTQSGDIDLRAAYTPAFLENRRADLNPARRFLLHETLARLMGSATIASGEHHNHEIEKFRQIPSKDGYTEDGTVLEKGGRDRFSVVTVRTSTRYVDLGPSRSKAARRRLCNRQLGSASGRLRAIKALTDLYGATEETKRTINKFASQIEALQIKRNRAVHDAWQTGLKSRRVYQLRVAIKDNKLLFDYDQRSVRELDRTIAQIRGLFLRAYRFRVRVVPLLLSSRAKSGPKPFARFETNPFPHANNASRRLKAAISRIGNEGP